MTKQISAQEERIVTAKGLHIFSKCDARSERAQNLSAICEDVARRRLQFILSREEKVSPLQIELHRINLDLRSQKGIFKARLTVKQKQILEQIAAIQKVSAETLHKLWEEYRYYVEKLEKKFKIDEVVVENVTTTIGRSVLAQRLGGDTTYSGTVNYTALGDNNTAAAVGDSTLGNEVYRKALSSGTDSNNISYLETFITAAEDADTYEEYGMFIDGTGSADTGQLFNRFVTQITKSLTETLNVQSVITFNDA